MTHVSAINGALSFLGKTTSASVVPTASGRNALSTLIASTAEDIAAMESIKSLSDGLFNWSKPRSTKNLMNAMSKALATPGKYQHAVELTSYISALSPLLEADRLARLYDTLSEVETTFSPLRYTLQANARLSRLLSPYGEDRIEKLAKSMWVETHGGRWWDLTAGRGLQNDAEHVTMTNKELLKGFLDETLNYSPTLNSQIAKIKYSEDIVEMLEEYRNRFLHGEVINPDTGVIASHIPWLSMDIRPENPIISLLDVHYQVCQDLEYSLPKKPTSFSKLFPDVQLYSGTSFPLAHTQLNMTDRFITKNLRMSLIRNATELFENKQAMGNCTYGYKDKMEKGTYALYKIVDEKGHSYNAAMTKNSNGGKWSSGEIKASQNRQPTAEVVAAFHAFVRAIPELTPAEIAAVKQREKAQEYMTSKSFSYTLV